MVFLKATSSEGSGSSSFLAISLTYVAVHFAAAGWALYRLVATGKIAVEVRGLGS